jgi:hypothetical protein
MLAAGAELSGSLASAVIGACASSVPTFTSTEEEAEAGAGEDNPGSDPGSAESATVASSWTEPGWTEAEAATSEVAANPATTELPRAAAVPAYTRPTTEASDRQTTKRNPDICESISSPGGVPKPPSAQIHSIEGRRDLAQLQAATRMVRLAVALEFPLVQLAPMTAETSNQ